MTATVVMNEKDIFITLTRWMDLVTSFGAVAVNFTDDQQSIDARLLERQQIIDSLQVLDAALAEIRVLRKAGWVGISVENREIFESLIEKGNVISASCVANDQQILDIATSLRAEVLDSLSKLRKSKGYLISSHSVKSSPSIIVDSHA